MKLAPRTPRTATSDHHAGLHVAPLNIQATMDASAPKAMDYYQTRFETDVKK